MVAFVLASRCSPFFLEIENRSGHGWIVQDEATELLPFSRGKRLKRENVDALFGEGFGRACQAFQVGLPNGL